MTDDHPISYPHIFRAFVDRAATHYDAVVDVPVNANRAEVRRRLVAGFDESPRIAAVMIRFNGQDVGIATREKVGRVAGIAGDGPAPLDPGSSDGATLPGLPGEFRPVVFDCVQSSCPVTLIDTFYDDRRIPECSGHGPMRLRS